MEQEPDSADYQTLAEFRYQIRRFIHFSETQARDCGIEPQQHQLLLALRGLPDGRRPTIGNLAERMQLKHHSAVELVNRMVGQGWIERVPGPDDKREVFVHLTPAGSELLHKLTVLHRQELEETGPLLAKILRKLTMAKKHEE